MTTEIVDPFPDKDPSDMLDYLFDWKALSNGNGTSDWLAPGEIITSYAVTVPAGITKVSESLTGSGTSVTVWLSGGTDGVDYPIACRITTNASRVRERTRTVPCRST